MTAALIGAASGVALAILGFWFKRVPTLETQREDFRVLIEPLQKEVGTLRERVVSLELARENDRRWRGIAIQYIRDLLAWSRPFSSEGNPLPAVPPEISEEV
ncbi:hypothetical protein GS532_21250 [Rhodococcus hoagii]|uniref:hypothetical protein n=1 Tax=Rhodococcus hoagii TaxID=43767 RepID=UPI000A10B352|nr:hypothetical protein [Prescottella equi]MBM4640718.1 hypothetical protein [Prescottella equi]MBM4670124.1 hypothetical protein [Prescottella equi]MBM4686260.1 hypothetical protein [Prescottella equi]NKV87415.1 hypothetical protein [Prescottella equi]NKV87781.1 hypothetical protein [Prescottella equi]